MTWQRSEEKKMSAISISLRRTALLAIVSAGAIGATVAPATADYYTTRCDRDGDNCYTVRCDNDGDDCDRVHHRSYYRNYYGRSYYGNGYYGNYNNSYYGNGYYGNGYYGDNYRDYRRDSRDRDEDEDEHE